MDRRARSLRVVAALRKHQLDKEAGKLVGLHGLLGQNRDLQQRNQDLAREADEIRELEAMPYISRFLTGIGKETDQLRHDEAVLLNEVDAQKSRVNQAWRRARTIEVLEEKMREDAAAREEKSRQALIDEIAIIGHLRRSR